MSELKHLQTVLLSMIKDIDLLCQKHNIRYYLLGGSAIGAIRHHGFIPWDDDLDIIMDNENYDRFIEICRTELDPQKYAVQVGLLDWTLYFSKIRLIGTLLKEEVSYTSDSRFDGIFIDVFKMDNVSSCRPIALWQYLCAKYFLCYQLLTGINNRHVFCVKKRLAMCMSLPLKISWLRSFIIKQVEQFNKGKTEYLGFFYGRTRFRTAIVKSELFGNPVRVPFEDTFLPVPERFHEYLTQMFGDYMTLPPPSKRRSSHFVKIDFGPY